MILSRLKSIYRKYQNYKERERKLDRRKKYLQEGQIPWSEGYLDYRNELIANSIVDPRIITQFSKNQVPSSFGYRLDERIVEYCWIFSRLPQNREIKVLDAGSTFNFDFILNALNLASIDLYIQTLYPEHPNFNEKKISYIYADLRDIPFKDSYFDVIISQSTIEHIDMDNSIYGYKVDNYHKDSQSKSYEYLKAIQEMLRVLKKGGKLLLTFPYGKFENHGFFQQLDEEMLDRILVLFKEVGKYELSFFRYLPNGWAVCQKEDCNDLVSYNPHTGQGKGTDGAAHCRSICCIEFEKMIQYDLGRNHKTY